ncbi:MAG: LysM peptidoglycan-binding domain-containing protein [Verrucomicrobiota bacterium]
MKAIRFLAPSLLSLAIVSCASSDKPGQYDTSDPYGTADSGQANANPVYDTPAAYEESGSTAATTAPAVNAPLAPYDPAAGYSTQTAPAVQPTAPPANTNGAAIIHTVVAGDTLSGIGSKYRVPIAEIKQANSMTSDVVVLGRKMVIPPAR